MFENKTNEEKLHISSFLQKLIAKSKENQNAMQETIKMLDDMIYHAKRKIAENDKKYK